MGLMKTLRTRLSEPGGSRWRKAAREQEKLMSEHGKRSLPLATEEEFDRFALDHERQAWAECVRCPLGTTRENVVWGEGKPGARLFLIGEGPGEQEDLSGRPFVGPSGVLLRRMIRAMKIERDDVWISNRVACRPPKNRKPHVPEIDACTPRLIAQLKLVRPKVILLLGSSAASLVKVKEIGKNRGPVSQDHWGEIPWEVREGLAEIHITYHPAYVLHQETPQKRRAAFRLLEFDVRRVAKTLRRIG